MTFNERIHQISDVLHGRKYFQDKQGKKEIIIYTAFVMETGGGIWPDMAFASKFVQIWNFSAKYYSVMQGMSL